MLLVNSKKSKTFLSFPEQVTEPIFSPYFQQCLHYYTDIFEITILKEVNIFRQIGNLRLG